MVVKKCEVIKVEAIVRGYITGASASSSPLSSLPPLALARD